MTDILRSSQSSTGISSPSFQGVVDNAAGKVCSLLLAAGLYATPTQAQEIQGAQDFASSPHELSIFLGADAPVSRAISGTKGKGKDNFSAKVQHDTAISGGIRYGYIGFESPLGGSFGPLGQFDFSHVDGEITGVDADVDTIHTSYGASIGLKQQWDLGNLFNPYVGGLVGARHTSASYKVNDNGVKLKGSDTNFKWEAIAGNSFELGAGFSLDVEGAYGNNPGIDVQGGDISISEQDTNEWGARILFTKKF